VSGTPQAAVRTPVGAIVFLAVLALLYAGVSVWGFRHLPGNVLAAYWLVLAMFFGVTAGLLAARRRMALPVYWTAVAMVVALRVAIALGRVDGAHHPVPRFIELGLLGMLVAAGLWISRREMREALR
jgi:4-amino-4-deoxy-L-arabinose transferase-like glycosyltransferase